MEPSYAHYLVPLSNVLSMGVACPCMQHGWSMPAHPRTATCPMLVMTQALPNFPDFWVAARGRSPMALRMHEGGRWSYMACASRPTRLNAAHVHVQGRGLQLNPQ